MSIHTRTATNPLQIRADSDGRTIIGTAVPYNVEARIGRYTETFAPGAFQGTDPTRIPVLAAHNRDDLPIGRTTAIDDTLDALLVELRISETAHGDDVLALVRDGAATGLSIGFIPAIDRWNPDRTRVTRVRAELVEVSIVGFPAYTDARIANVRNLTSTSPRLALARWR